MVHGPGYPLLAFFEHVWVDVQDPDVGITIGMLLTSMVQ
jgi:hypothetical protein